MDLASGNGDANDNGDSDNKDSGDGAEDTGKVSNDGGDGETRGNSAEESSKSKAAFVATGVLLLITIKY